MLTLIKTNSGFGVKCMKKLVIGVGSFLSGMILFCTDYATNRIIESMPNVSLLSGGISLSLVAFLLIIVGIVLILCGYSRE